MSKKFAVFSENMTLLTMMIEGVHVIPEDAVLITDVLHKKIINETDGVWTLLPDGSISKEPLPSVASDYPALIASTRYNHEVAGIVVEGVQIDTDRASQSLITGAALSAILDDKYVCTWKASTGAVQLNAAQLISVATAVRTHVQACFDRECELLAAVADNTYVDAMLADGWPV